MREPWRESADTVADGLRTDLDGGLTTAAAAARLERTGANVLAAAATVPAWRKVVAQLRNPLIYLLFAAALVSLIAWIVGGRTSLPWDAIVVTAIVVANAVLGYVQEARAEHAVAALQQMAAPTATVLRDRDLRRIPSAEIVPGDVLVLAEGDAVAADGRLAEAAALMVAEAALTGESEPVLKRVAPIQGDVGLGDRANMVFSGTTILRGRAPAVVTATGMSTQVGRIAGLLDLAEPPETPLQREVDRVGRMLGVAVLAITVVVVAAILLTSHIDSASAFVAVLLVGVSLAVAAVPEGLPAVLSVVLALGVQRMARRRAIVKKLASVETLGSATVVCSDKTGTLTRNEMTIQKIVSASGEVDVTGTGYRPEGALVIDDRPLVDATLLDECRAVLLAGSLANDAVLRDRGGSWTVEGDPTEAAFLVAEAKIEGLADARSARFERIGEVPFTSERRLMTTVQADRTGDLGVAVVTKGAPDVLLARCAAERVRGADRPLRDGRREEILADVARLAGLGLRPLAVAYRALAPTDECCARRVGRARPRVPRHGRDHGSAARRGACGDRRRARRRRAGGDDHG